ncbi:MAG: SCP-2 sterol transfer family protein [Gammaproteobacteria bacterium]|nr:SCP-2 sterol transfer family protein [Gammaproteobacteria bacterium]
MEDLFSDEWMKAYMGAWNNEPSLSGELAEIGFNSNIGYGFDGNDAPTGVLIVENGVATAAGAFNGEALNWDLRATQANWDKWRSKGIGMAGLGMAYATRKLKFQVGDYGAMIKDPRMAGPFIISFSVMGQI